MRQLWKRLSKAACTVGSFLQAGWIQTRRWLTGIRILLADIAQATTRRKEQQAGFPGGQ